LLENSSILITGVTHIAHVIASGTKQEIIGICPGPQLHKQMTGKEDSYFAHQYSKRFKTLVRLNSWGVIKCV